MATSRERHDPEIGGDSPCASHSNARGFGTLPQPSVQQLVVDRGWADVRSEPAQLRRPVAMQVRPDSRSSPHSGAQPECSLVAPEAALDTRQPGHCRENAQRELVARLAPVVSTRPSCRGVHFRGWVAAIRLPSDRCLNPGPVCQAGPFPHLRSKMSVRRVGVPEAGALHPGWTIHCLRPEHQLVPGLTGGFDQGLDRHQQNAIAHTLGLGPEWPIRSEFPARARQGSSPNARQSTARWPFRADAPLAPHRCAARLRLVA